MSETEWLGQLTVAEEHLIPADLRRAAELLRATRIPGEGWGADPRVSTNLQVTAQVISALQTLRYPKARELAATVATWAHRSYEQQPPTTAQDAIALLVLATADQETEGSYPEELRTSLRTALKDLDSDQLSTLTLAQAVLATELWPDEHRSRAEPWVQELVRRGQGADAWEKAGLPEESLPVTALAVRALAPWQQQKQVATVMERGLEHLRSHLFAHGWASPALSGTYVLSLVLRALVCDTDSEPELSEEGFDLLRSRQCPDGGWTGTEASHGSSSFEHTAAAITALAESGCCRYVPLLAGRGVIRQLTKSLDEVTQREAALEDDIQGQVEERVGQALTDRDQLRKQLKNRETELRNRETELKKRQAEIARLRLIEYGEEIEPKSRLTLRLPTWLRPIWVALTVQFIGIAVVVLAVFPKSFGTVSKYALGAIGAILLIMGFVLQWRDMRSYSPPSLPESPSIGRSRRLVGEFMDATEDLSTSAREELVYRLAREGTDLPPRLFVRFLTELTNQLKIDRETSRRLRGWMEKFATMEPQDRQALISQLRRAVL